MKPFVPDNLPLDSIDWVAHIRKIGEAHTALGGYDGMLQSIVNPGLLLSPLTTQEAVLSSKIEGTQATLDEVLEYEADPNDTIGANKQADIQEIINYRSAINYAVEKLQSHPLTLNVIKEIHKTLLDGVRGRNKAAGEFRRIQNFIGAPGSQIEQATYVPPSPEMLMPALDNWEKYIHSDEIDGIIQLAIVKAQFEIIHPFLDGNGRIGRILIPLFLYEKKLLESPMFYLSAYLESNRDEYYNRLKAITATGDWNGWIDFFLTAVIEQSKVNASKAKAIHDLYETTKVKIPDITNSQFAVRATDALFSSPIITNRGFMLRSKIPKGSATRIVNTLREHKILLDVRKPKGRRTGRFLFVDLYDIVK